MAIPTTFPQDALKLSREELARKYSVIPDTITRWKKKLGISQLPNQKPPEIITIKPKIYRPTVKPPKGQSQVQVLLLSDTHAGAVTATYSADVFKSRLERLYNSVTLIRELQTKQHPLDELVIFSLGDLVQGENVGIQMALDEYCMSVYNQVYKLWVPAMVEFLLNLLRHYRKITWYGVRGNHGNMRDRRLSSRDSNWDIVAQQTLSSSVHDNNITFHIEPVSFYNMADILGWKYFLCHGDVIKMNYTTPYYGIDRKTGDWEVLFRPHVFCFGHFHSPSRLRPRTVPILVNGTFKSNDEWAIGVIGKSGPPAQLTFGVHPERPVSWFYELDLS